MEDGSLNSKMQWTLWIEKRVCPVGKTVDNLKHTHPCILPYQAPCLIEDFSRFDSALQFEAIIGVPRCIF